MFSSVLIPNRGEIAVRIIRACRDLGVASVLAASSVDADQSLAARLADRVVRIGGPRPSDSYLNVGGILETARALGVDALHPGYGFLSEDARLARGLAELGVAFCGPSAAVLENVGDKARARGIALEAGVPVARGRVIDAPTAALAKALDAEVGYPLLIKATHGGGGRGMRLVVRPDDFVELAQAAAAEAQAAFGSPELYAEHFVDRARHVEVQIFGVPGRVLVLGDRDCSVQRRHQKLVEEAPAVLDDDVRASLHAAARRLGALLAYEGAGTVEFVLDPASGEFFFLEVNARLQVEHPVTEVVTGHDIVRAQLEVASGESTALVDEPELLGAAIECRINAESPDDGFRPSPGTITNWRPPTALCARTDSHCFGGYVVPPYYDSLLAKVVVCGRDRAEAIAAADRALGSFVVEGVDTTLAWTRRLVASRAFAGGEIHTRWVDDRAAAGLSAAVDVE